MRLTLRTLLAYMDGVLESEDAEEIARKIEESEYATEIVHRTRDVVRRLRLGAPPLEPRGKGLDANSVAEYLDNTLSSDRVSDFEALCLDTDIHLAEVAGCHQILTYVLGAPAEIEPETRQRIYSLVAGDSGAVVAKDAPASSAKRATAASNGASNLKSDDKPEPRKEPLEVPDYLRDQPPAPKTGRVIAAILVLLVTGAIIVGMQPSWLPGFLKFEGAEQLAKGDGKGDQSSDETDQSATDKNANAGVELQQPENAGELGNQDSADGANANGNDAGATNIVPSIPPLPEKDGPPNSNNAGDNSAADNASGETVNASGDANIADTGNAAGTDANAGEVADPNLPPDQPPVQLPSRVVGQLTSTDSVLLRFGGSPPSLSRLPQRGNVSTGEPLISLPDFRNVITLGDGLTLQAVGETHFEFEAIGAETDLPRINLKQGRILITTVGGTGTRLRLRTDDSEYALTFLQPGSSVAISARRVRANDAVPNETRCLVELVVDALAGKTVWESFARGGRWELAAGTRWAQSAIPSDPIVAQTAAPAWATSMGLPPLAARAAEQVEQYLRGELAVRVRQALLEQVAINRIEVSSLAIRCLTAVDDFDTAVDCLGDDRYRAFWDEQVESLQRSVLRSPESAELVKIALDSRRTDEAPELYRMLWDYTATDLKDGGHAAKLVEYLLHDDLDFRVLATWNLRNITGITNINYRPESSLSLRQRAARSWQLKLESGDIVPRAGGSAN